MAPSMLGHFQEIASISSYSASPAGQIVTQKTTFRPAKEMSVYSTRTGKTFLGQGFRLSARRQDINDPFEYFACRHRLSPCTGLALVFLVWIWLR